MAGNLVVIIGAGASFDCAVQRSGEYRNPITRWRPPLTRELFEPRAGSFAEILDLYPGAQAAAADIRVLLVPSPEKAAAFQLEKYLREELKESSNEDARYRFRQIPLYLQHLLFEVSRQYTTEPENYSRLVNGALGAGLDNVVFITLNYDTLLDRQLFTRTPQGAVTGNPKDTFDYISDDRSWVLIKLHGSVNWGRRVHAFVRELPAVEEGPVYTGWFESITDRIDAGAIDREIELRLFTDVSSMRRRDQDLYYPAVSVPIGPDPALTNCPEAHVSALRQRLKRMRGKMNVLVIGYSGLDDEVMDLLAEGGAIRSLALVDIDPEAIHKEFERKFSDGLSPEYFAEGFANWAQSPALHDYFTRISDSNPAT